MGLVAEGDRGDGLHHSGVAGTAATLRANSVERGAENCRVRRVLRAADSSRTKNVFINWSLS